MIKRDDQIREERAITEIEAVLRRYDCIMIPGMLFQVISAKHSTTFENVQKVIYKYFKVDGESLRSKSRKKAISYARSIAIYLCRRNTDESLKSIGRAFNRKHSTISYNYEKIKNNIRDDQKIRLQVEFLSKQIASMWRKDEGRAEDIFG